MRSHSMMATVVSYGYIFDKRNRPVTATLPGLHTVTYTEADERDVLAFPNGVTTSLHIH